MLSNDENEMVAQFANEIDISNAKQVIQYGSSAQKSISDFSVNILGKVKTSELGDVGDALKELTVALDATTEPEKKGILGIWLKNLGLTILIRLFPWRTMHTKRRSIWTGS